jgi:hypothetical protein
MIETKSKAVSKPEGLGKIEKEVKAKGLSSQIYFCEGEFVLQMQGSKLRKVGNGDASIVLTSSNIGYLLAEARDILSKV